MIAAGLLYLGFFALAGSMSRHRPALLEQWQRVPLVTRHLSLLGWGAILLSLVATILAPRAGIALVTWCGLLPVTAGVVVLSLTYRPMVAQAGIAAALSCVLIGSIMLL